MEVEYHRRRQLRQQLQLSEEEVRSWMKRRSEADRGGGGGHIRVKRYSQEDLKVALREIIEGNSVSKTSKKFNIPQRTLYDKLKKFKEKSEKNPAN